MMELKLLGIGNKKNCFFINNYNLDSNNLTKELLLITKIIKLYSVNIILYTIFLLTQFLSKVKQIILILF